MLDSERWRSRVIADSQTLCPACQSTNLTMGACASGSMAAHQEYVWKTASTNSRLSSLSRDATKATRNNKENA